VPRPDVAPTVGAVVADIVAHPIDRLVWRWNWKSAVLSALIRGSLFFAVNLTAGWHAAVGAFTAELVFRGLTSGFYGAITQAFVPARPVWVATATTMVLLPLVSHLLEFAVHYARGTPQLAESIAASAAFTGLSTAFNLFAMRRGALVIGPRRAPIGDDLRRMPRLVIEFAAAVVGALSPLWRRRGIL
jgi:hypothetical protein